MSERETDPRDDERRDQRERPEEAERPAPGVKHETEPDAENIMPAKDRPGTF